MLLQAHMKCLAAATGACLLLALYRDSALHQRTPHIFRARAQPEEQDSEEDEGGNERALPAPYSPESLPGGRNVHTPYGMLRVYEWGPCNGSKVLLLGGISTPSVVLSDLAESLVRKGNRVMLFDYFGRGYSDAPTAVVHNTALYITQILLVLASSEVSWTGSRAFHVIGYSFGGAMAMALVKHLPGLAKSVTLVAPSGLIRDHHVLWQARLLYRDGWLPTWLRRLIITRRLQIPERPSIDSNTKSGGNADATGGPSYDYAAICSRTPEITVADVLNWQLANHPGFSDAFISCMNHTPMFAQTALWRSVGDIMRARRTQDPEDSAGGVILLILGSSDPGIVKEELIPDAASVLGADGFKLVVVDAGHEIAITRGPHIADIATSFWASSKALGE